MLKNLAPIALLAVAYCFPVAAQVPDADVKSYLRTFSERPRPNSQPKSPIDRSSQHRIRKQDGLLENG